MLYIDEALTVDQYHLYKEQGLHDRDIMEKLYYSGNSMAIMSNWKKRNGLSICRGKRKKFPNSFTAAHFLELKRAGFKNREIMQKYGVNKDTLSAWVKEQKELGNLPKRWIKTGYRKSANKINTLTRKSA